VCDGGRGAGVVFDECIPMYLSMWEKFVVGLTIFVLVVLVVTAALPHDEAPRPECAEVYIRETWNGMERDGTMVGHMHAVLVAPHEFVLNYREVIPEWPLALLCSFPPTPDSA